MAVQGLNPAINFSLSPCTCYKFEGASIEMARYYRKEYTQIDPFGVNMICWEYYYSGNTLKQ